MTTLMDHEQQLIVEALWLLYYQARHGLSPHETTPRSVQIEKLRNLIQEADTITVEQ